MKKVEFSLCRLRVSVEGDAVCRRLSVFVVVDLERFSNFMADFLDFQNIGSLFLRFFWGGFVGLLLALRDALWFCGVDLQGSVSVALLRNSCS